MASVTYHRGRAEFEFPYNPLVIEAIKQINSRYRSYDPGSKVWTVWDPYIHDAVYAVKTCFPDTDEIGEYQGTGPSRSRSYSSGFDGYEGTTWNWVYSDDQKRRRRVFFDTGELGHWQDNPGYQNASQDRQEARSATETPEGPYRVLMISPDAPWAVVRAVYGALAKTYHPDVYKGEDGPDRMKAINQAYAEVKKLRGE